MTTSPPDRPRTVLDIDKKIARAVTSRSVLDEPAPDVVSLLLPDGRAIEVMMKPGHCEVCGQTVKASVVIKLPASKSPRRPGSGNFGEAPQAPSRSTTQM